MTLKELQPGKLQSRCSSISMRRLGTARRITTVFGIQAFSMNVLPGKCLRINTFILIRSRQLFYCYSQEKDDAALCDSQLHGAHRSVLGAVAWIVLTRAELAVYVQAPQGRAHAPPESLIANV